MNAHFGFTMSAIKKRRKITNLLGISQVPDTVLRHAFLNLDVIPLYRCRKKDSNS